MSHDGKMRRGAKWFSFRNSDGDLPDEIKNHPGKSADVQYFLDNQEPVEEVKPEKKEKKKDEAD